MDDREIARLLDEAELIPLVEGRIEELKRLRQRCLEAEIPVALGAVDACNTKSCGAKARLLVREQDAREVATLLQRDWIAAVEAEGTAASFGASAPNEDGELPCPACGTAAPLVEGACSDCGLQLE